MASIIPEGQLGNLKSEQEKKLQQIWNTVFKLNRVFDDVESKPVNGTPATPQKLNRKQFRTLASAAGIDTADMPDELLDLLSAQTPESIRSMVMGSVKHEHPTPWRCAMDWRYDDAKVDEIMMQGEEGAVRDEKSSDKAVARLGSDFLKQLRMGKGFVHGTDREGRPISIVRVRLHKPFDQSAQSLEKFMTFLIETGRYVVSPPIETACLLFDMTGFGLANMDYTPLKFIIRCFEANYPESLGVILIHNAPWVFNGIWHIIQNWLDPVVAGKVNFTYGRAGLEPFIAPHQILRELGGDEDWEYKYEEPRPGENEKMNDAATRDRLLQERELLAARFEQASRAWVDAADGGGDATSLAAERNDIAEQIRVSYWTLDPYVRARSVYDRLGYIGPGGTINWYSKSGTA